MSSILNQAYDSDTFRKMGHELVDLLADYLAEARHGVGMPVLPQREPDELYRKYARMLESPGGFSAREFFTEVVHDSNHLHHPRYVGHQLCGPLPLSALSGLAAGLLNNGSAIFEMGPANTAMERVVLELTAEAMGFATKSEGVLTSGGSLGNLTALLAARRARFDPADPRPVGFLVPASSHYSNAKSLRIMGLPEDCIIPVPVDDASRILLPSLQPSLKESADRRIRVIGLVANACTTGTGVYDNLRAVSRFCRDNGLWLHVDGAHGTAAVFSDRYRHLLSGIEEADSVVVDFHKMLLAPGLITAVLFRDGRDSYRTFSEQASYLWKADEEQEWFDFSKRTLECTKLMMGLKLFSVIKAFGTELYGEFVDRSYDLARAFAEAIRARNHFELAVSPESNIVCFRFIPPDLEAAEIDRLNARIRHRIVKDGDFYLVQVVLRKGLFMRAALMNPFTTIGDLELLLDRVEDEATPRP